MLATSDDSESPQPNQVDVVESSTPRVLLILASVLERLVARNEQLIEPSGSSQVHGGHLGANLKVFHGVRAPSISLPKYLERLYKYTNCSPSCFVVGYVYIDRLIHKHPEMLVVSHNVHRLLLTSLMIASKMLDDEQYNNAFYAKVGGVSNPELNRLELELLFLLDFEVMVSSPVFESYCWYLEKDVVRTPIADQIHNVPHFDLTEDILNGNYVQETESLELSKD